MSTTRSHRPASADPPDPAATDPRPPYPVRGLRVAMGTVVAASAAPYGYTISVWCSGALLMGAHGLPRTLEVFAFLAGAVAGYGLVGLLAQRALTRMEFLDRPQDRVRAGMMHWFAVGAAVGTVALVAELPSALAWPLSSFAATTVYLLGASAQLAFISTRRGRGGRI